MQLETTAKCQALGSNMLAKASENALFFKVREMSHTKSIMEEMLCYAPKASDLQS